MEEVIKGNIKSKLKLLILSGIHGDEYNPCILLKFIKEDTTLINFLKDKYKSITFLYNVNTNGIMNNTRESINIDLNRLYSYDFSDIDNIKSLINKSTHIIDLHSSPHCDNFILINKTNTANSYVEFALNNNIKYLLYSQYNQFTIKHQSQLLNKISITFEMNGLNKITINDVINAKHEIDKILYNLHNIIIKEETPKYQHQKSINAQFDGIHYIFNNELVCFSIDGITNSCLIEDGFIITYPIKGYYKKDESVIILQPINKIK